MNLYKLHNDPESLHKHDKKENHVPVLIQKSIKEGKKLTAEQINTVSRVPFLALYYAENAIKGPWPPGEKAIATKPNIALRYARNTIKGPWPPGEKAIARDMTSAYHYADEVIKGKWSPGEKIILTDPTSAQLYARNVIKDKWPPGEKVMATVQRVVEAYNEHLHAKGYTESDFIELRR